MVNFIKSNSKTLVKIKYIDGDINSINGGNYQVSYPELRINLDKTPLSDNLEYLTDSTIGIKYKNNFTGKTLAELLTRSKVLNLITLSTKTITFDMPIDLLDAQRNLFPEKKINYGYVLTSVGELPSFGFTRDRGTNGELKLVKQSHFGKHFNFSNSNIAYTYNEYMTTDDFKGLSQSKIKNKVQGINFQPKTNKVYIPKKIYEPSSKDVQLAYNIMKLASEEGNSVILNHVDNELVYKLVSKPSKEYVGK